jgi:hypothetical protein
MVAFDRQVDMSSDLAFRLVANTFVTLFWRLALFDETTDWLRTHGYDVVRLNASDWVEEADLRRELAAALEFPSYYGKNLDALNDCMRDVVTFDYGTSPEATGLVLAFTGYDRFAAHCPRAAQIVLDVMAGQARSAALIGHRMMCLVQTDDPNIEFDPVGAMPVMWNHGEWLDAKRRPHKPA